MENNTNKNITSAIYESKHDDQVLEKAFDFDAAEEADTEMEDTTEIKELQLDNEVLDNVIVNSNENTELTTTE